MKLPSLKSRKVTRDPVNLVTDLLGNLAVDFGLQHEPKVQRALSLLKNKKYLGFLQETDSWTSQTYTSATEHFRWNQLACLLKKYPFDDDSIDREKTAMEKFYAAEHQCRRMNQFFRALRARPEDPRHRVLHVMREYIRDVLGETPDMERIYGMCGFGPGAAVGTHGNKTHVGVKLTGDWTVTPTALPYATAALLNHHQLIFSVKDGIICLDPADISREFQGRCRLVPHNNITCVPKTAKTDRTIAIEPLWNSYLQKGIDNYMRQKLRRIGVDLTDQSKNQELARLGSIDSSYATIDLSAASDSVSIELCRELLPPDWFNLLRATRSPCYKYGDEIRRYEKFASMGNGFCFPLESLIFAAAVHSVYVETGHAFRLVYGDDIIVQQGSALLVIERLKFLGFKTNTDKTFCLGPFRESCGADYYLGVNVRPYYIDKPPVNWWDIYGWLNGLRRIGADESWRRLYSTIPKPWRLLRPFDGADTAITTSQDYFMSSPYAKWHRDEHRWRYPEVLHIGKTDKTAFPNATVWYGILHGSYCDGFTLRRETRTRLRYN